MTEFKKGDLVKVVRKFRSDEGDLYWMPAMDKLVGVTAKVERVDEVGDVLLDCGWYFYPRVLEHVNKPHVAQILVDKKVVNGVRCYEILGFDGVLQKDELPKRYTDGRPAFWKNNTSSSGAHVFDGVKMGWRYPDGSNCRLFMELPAGVKIDVGDWCFVGMSVGDVWPERTFQELLTWLKRAGSRLAKILQQEKDAWSGKETIEI